MGRAIIWKALWQVSVSQLLNMLLTCSQLLGLYLIIGLAFLVYPDDATDAPSNLVKHARSLVGF